MPQVGISVQKPSKTRPSSTLCFMYYVQTRSPQRDSVFNKHLGCFSSDLSRHSSLLRAEHDILSSLGPVPVPPLHPPGKGVWGLEIQTAKLKRSFEILDLSSKIYVEKCSFQKGRLRYTLQFLAPRPIPTPPPVPQAAE